jgi:hypothetical protein
MNPWPWLRLLACIMDAALEPIVGTGLLPLRRWLRRRDWRRRGLMPVRVVRELVELVETKCTHGTLTLGVVPLNLERIR